MQLGGGWLAFWVLSGSALLCGTALYLWALARGKLEAQVMIVALWLVMLTMSVIMGPPWVIVMGAATVLMGLWIVAGLWWLP